jgi:hypothetical protein
LSDKEEKTILRAFVEKVLQPASKTQIELGGFMTVWSAHIYANPRPEWRIPPKLFLLYLQFHFCIENLPSVLVNAGKQEWTTSPLSPCPSAFILLPAVRGIIENRDHFSPPFSDLSRVWCVYEGKSHQT